ncbi:MAG TPA: glycosyltransferase [Thermoanaerobaculia bacterium]
MRELRAALRNLLPGPLRERYHEHALRRDFGIDRRRGSRPSSVIDPLRAPGLNLIGYFDSSSGVGQSARSIADAAARAGIDVHRIEASAGQEKAAAPYDVNLFHVNADGAAATVEEMGPDLHRGRANIGYWYWESEEFPKRWQNRFDYFDEIWVASDYCRRAIAAASPVPVVLLPPAVVVARRENAKRQAGVEDSGYLFLTMLDALSVPERKNPLGAVRAFARAFPEAGEASLLVLICNSEREPGLAPSLREASRGARVRIREEALPRNEVEALLSACDAYVSLHRSEGFGLPIAEAMSAGKPVVATAYSGNADYLDEATGFPVAWSGFTLPRTIRDYDSGTRWAEPNEEHAIERLREVFENRAEARRRGEAARRRIAERYSPGVIGDQIASRMAQIRERLKATA